MMKQGYVFLLIFGLAPALAGELSYNIIEGGYERIDMDEVSPGIEPDGDGFGLGGSFELGESWFVGASYAAFDVDFGFGFDVDVDQLSVGVGYHVPITERADWFATVAYLRAEISDSPVGSITDDGYGVTVGARGLLADNFELDGSVGYADLGDGADGVSVGVGAVYRFNDSFGLRLAADFGEDARSFGIGARVYFGN